MRKINLKKLLPKLLIILYSLAMIVFLIKNIMVLVNKPKITSSSIPTLSTVDINQAIISLKSRTDVGFPNNVDLGGYQFGKTEPF